MSNAPSRPDLEVNLREIGGILRRNRLLLVACTLAGMALGLGYGATRDPSYEASSLILVRAKEIPHLTAANALSPTPATPGQVGTEMEILQSRTLLGAVVDSLRLQLRVAEPAGTRRDRVLAGFVTSPDAEAGRFRLERQADGRFRTVDEETGRVVGTFAVGERIELPGATLALAPEAAEHPEITLAVQTRSGAISELLRTLKVSQPGQDVNLIRVTYEGSDPTLVRDVPNALTARFMALRESIQKAEAHATVAFLREQLDTLAVQLASSEEELRDFRESRRVIDPQLEATTQVGRIAELQAQRMSLEAERASLAGLLAEVQADPRSRGGSDSPYRRLIAFPSLLSNSASSELLRSLAEAENRRSELSGRRSRDDPEMQVLTTRVAEIEGQLRGITTTYLAGLTNQVAAMDQILGGYRAQLNEAPSKEVAFQRLSRKPRVLQQMYELLQTRLKEAEIAQAVEDPNVRVVDPADLPREPSGPGGGLFGGAAAVVGLLFGLGVVFVREYSDTAVRTRADLQAALGMPVLGLIPRRDAAPVGRGWRDRLAPRQRLLLPARSSASEGEEGAAAPAAIARRAGTPSPLTDAYSRLHTNLLFSRDAGGPKVLLFTSPLPGDGKTTTAVNFAAMLAEAGLKVLLIDADLRRGGVHEAFGVGRSPGLTNLLGDEPVFEGVLRRVEVGAGRSLRFIPVGDPTAHPVQVLSSPLMRELLESTATEYDRVVIDSPPLNLFPDAAVLSAQVDGVVVVARAGSTPFDALVDTAEQLRQTSAPVVGSVLNGVDYERDAAYDRSYRWQALESSYYTEPKPGAGATA